MDGDGVGDPCDADVDGVDHGHDNCPAESNPGQGDVCDTDNDGNGVDDGSDLYPGTQVGEYIDAEGCSSHLWFGVRCPIGVDYKNYGEYVLCVADETEHQVEQGLILENDKGDIVSAAVQSSVCKPLGKK